MTVGMISRRYAKALFEYAREKGMEKTVAAEMKAVAATFQAEPRLRVAMNNPIVTAKDKLKLLKAVVGSDCSDVFEKFMNLVIKNKREGWLQFIVVSYDNLYCKANHINKARLVTASPVDNAVVDRLKMVLNKIKPGTQEIESEVNPEIEGGFVLYVDTFRLDASVASQLKHIKKQFILENNRVG